MDLIFALGCILTVGYFFGLVAEKLAFPRVTAYLAAGILFSPSLLGDVVNLKLHLWSNIFSDLCLGFIAYIVGSEIHLGKLKKHGKDIIWGTLFSSMLPVILVAVSLYFLSDYLGIPPYVAFVLAAISSTTAPAATVAVIEQYHAKGQLTDTTLGIVALDDALGILIYFAISSVFFPNADFSGAHLIVKEILLSVFVGVFFGFMLSKFSKFSHTNDFLFPLLIGLVLLVVSLSVTFHFSSMLTLIILGFVANSSNIKKHPRVSLLLPIQHIEEFIFILFFTFTGIHFSPVFFEQAIVIIGIYSIMRALGKYFGAYIGLKVSKNSNKKLGKFLGLTLLPQAGVAIGLLFQAIHNPVIKESSQLLINIALGSTMIYSLIGPFLAKFALKEMNEF